MRLIDADVLTENLNRQLNDRYWNMHEMEVNMMENALTFVRIAPTIYTSKRAKWMLDEKNDNTICSHCGRACCQLSKAFCAYCGAEMEE